jgi:hypothetical protein
VGELSDGAAYDPVADRWRSLPAAPLSARSEPGAAWTGRELVVWGGFASFEGSLGDGAAYDPEAGGWRALAPTVLRPRVGHVAAWDGSALVVWGGDDGVVYDDGAAWTPGS